MGTRTSGLDYALLGLLARGAASGYDLRKVFQSTLLGSYSDSPGSVYPALRRLERRGHVESLPGEGPRGRRAVRLTAAGRAVLREWIETPVVPADLDRGTDECDLRLAFVSDVAPERLRPFLGEYARALEARADAVRDQRASRGPDLSPSARAALAVGLVALEAKARWCAGTAAGETDP
jgi:DNA-binding PadR family transcriptional regulator